MPDALKGVGRTLITLHGEGGELHLVLFADQSLAIRRSGITAGVWEADQHDDCFRELACMSGMDQILGVPLVSVLVACALSKDRASVAGPLPCSPIGGESMN